MDDNVQRELGRLSEAQENLEERGSERHQELTQRFDRLDDKLGDKIPEWDFAASAAKFITSSLVKILLTGAGAAIIAGGGILIAG